MKYEQEIIYLNVLDYILLLFEMLNILKEIQMELIQLITDKPNNLDEYKLTIIIIYYNM